MIVKLSSSNIITVTDFFRILQECVFAEFGRDKISFFSAYPIVTDAQEIKTPIITYYYRQVPFSFQGTKEIKGRRAPGDRTIARTERGETISVDFTRQRFDNLVTFEVWESSGMLADELAERFRKFITSLIGYFKGLGVSELFFLELDGEKPEKQWRTDLVKRTLKYQVIIDEIISVSSPNMSAFGIEGFVYKSIFHLLGKEGTAIDKIYSELPVVGDPVAAFTPNAGTVVLEDDDVVEIQLVQTDTQ